MYKFGDLEESREKGKIVCISVLKIACKILFLSFPRILHVQYSAQFVGVVIFLP